MTLAFLITGPVLADDAVQGPPKQSIQRFVPQHFTSSGQYVAPHYEAPKPPPFHGHYADKQAMRDKAKVRGYKEPAPDYTTRPPDDDKRGEGR